MTGMDRKLLFAPPTEAELEESKRADLFAPPTEEELREVEREIEISGTSGIESAIRGFFDTLTFGFDDESGALLEALGSKFGVRGLGGEFKDIRWESDEEDKKGFMDVYRETRDKRRRDKKRNEEANPGAYTAGQVAGGVTSGLVVPGSVLGKGASLGSKVLQGAGTGAVEGALFGAGSSEADLLEGEVDDLVEDTIMGGGTGTLVGGALPLAVAGAKGAARGGKKLVDEAVSFVPGTAGARKSVNRLAANVASVVPGSTARSDDIFRMLDDVDLRRKSSKVDLDARTMSLVDDLNRARSTIDEAVSKRYAELEEAANRIYADRPSVLSDLEETGSFLEKLMSKKKMINENKNFYGQRAKKIYDDVIDILQRGGPKEQGLPNYGKAITDIGKEGPQYLTRAVKKRLLNARRHIDDFMKNKNFDNLSQYEKEAIGELRDMIDVPLKASFTGAEDLRVADILFSDKQKRSLDFFKPLLTRTPSGDEVIDPEKLRRFLRSSGFKGDTFKKRATALEQFVDRNKDVIGDESVKKAINSVKELSELGRFQGFNEVMKRGQGGPTSQGINGLLQGLAAFYTGGTSLLLTPFTNPYYWTRVVDGTSDFMQSLGKKIPRLAPRHRQALQEAARRGGNALAVTHFLLGQQDPEYQAVMGGDEEDDDQRDRPR